MSIHTASLHQRIDPSMRTRARGMFAVLRSSNVSRRRAYVATVAAYGRPLVRAYYWDMLPLSLRRLISTL